MKRAMKTWIAGATILLSSALTAVQAADLSMTVFNPGKKSLFPVTSTLITGPTEAVLIDAQFQRDDAQSVLKMIQKSGKNLKTIYISHGDPDFYFGLDVITAAYPNAQVVASAETLKHIKATVDKKVNYWGPILAENAPKKTIMPSLLKGDTLSVDGETLNVIGLDGNDPKHTYVWIPSIKTVTGGVLIYENVHVWMADSKTAASRDKWLNNLDQILALKPAKIVPGHFIGKSPMDASAVTFTQQYVRDFEDAAVTSKDAASLTKAMQKHYPAFSNKGDLELSAKVVKGEMQWP